MSTFTDVPDTHPLIREIEWSAAAGLLPAHTAGLFRPTWNVSRSGLALALFRLSGEPDYAVPTLFAFPDVSADHGLARMIHWAQDRGLITGHLDGTFRPDAALTRADAADALYRSAGSPDYTAPADSAFQDVATGHPAYRQIHWLQAQGVDDGWADGTYRPNRPVTRADMAVLLSRFDERF